MKKVKSPELPAYSAADSQEKDRVQKHPKKVRVQPHTNTTESSFLLISDPLEDLNFRFFGLSFFQQIFMKKVKRPELPAYSAADLNEKDRVQKHPKKVRVQPHKTLHRIQYSPRFRQRQEQQASRG